MAKKRVKRDSEAKIDFEVALAKLETIARDLEEGEIGLTESLARYEEGVKLLRNCYEMLDGAQRRIELLTGVDAEGRPVAEPVDDSELTLSEKAARRGARRSAKSSTPPANGGAPESGADMDDPQGMI